MTKALREEKKCSLVEASGNKIQISCFPIQYFGSIP